jgi:hypothetical protein
MDYFDNTINGETGAGERAAAFTEINLPELRSDRQRPGLNNSLCRYKLITIDNAQLTNDKTN